MLGDLLHGGSELFHGRGGLFQSGGLGLGPFSKLLGGGGKLLRAGSKLRGAVLHLANHVPQVAGHFVQSTRKLPDLIPPVSHIQSRRQVSLCYPAGKSDADAKRAGDGSGNEEDGRNQERHCANCDQDLDDRELPRRGGELVPRNVDVRNPLLPRAANRQGVPHGHDRPAKQRGGLGLHREPPSLAHERNEAGISGSVFHLFPDKGLVAACSHGAVGGVDMGVRVLVAADLFRFHHVLETRQVQVDTQRALELALRVQDGNPEGGDHDGSPVVLHDQRVDDGLFLARFRSLVVVARPLHLVILAGLQDALAVRAPGPRRDEASGVDLSRHHP